MGALPHAAGLAGPCRHHRSSITARYPLNRTSSAAPYSPSSCPQSARSGNPGISGHFDLCSLSRHGPHYTPFSVGTAAASTLAPLATSEPCRGHTPRVLLGMAPSCKHGVRLPHSRRLCRPRINSSSGADCHHTGSGGEDGRDGGELGAGETSRLDIELVTQVSLDRWPRFAQQALAWGGPASVAVYLPCPHDHPLAPAYMEHLNALAARLREQLEAAAAAAAAAAATAASSARSSGYGSGDKAAAAAAITAARLTVTVVHAGHLAAEGAAVLPGVVPPLPPSPQLPPSSPNTSAGTAAEEAAEAAEKDATQSYRYDRLYPINALRNAALRAATCSHVFLVDGDFIPSAGLKEALLEPRRQPPPTAQRQPPTSAGAAASGLSGEPDALPSTTATEASRPPPLPLSRQRQTDAALAGAVGAATAATAAAVANDDDGHASRSLLERSDRHTRPVMWVVPAFELAGTAGGSGGGTVAATAVLAGPGSAAATAAAGVAAAGAGAGVAAPGAGAAAGEVPDEEAACVPRTLEQLAAYTWAAGTAAAVDASTSGASGAAVADAGGGGGGGGLVLRPFHCGRYPQPVPSIDYGAWWRCALGRRGDGCGDGGGGDRGRGGEGSGSNKGWMAVSYHEYFEPYGILRRDQVPEYDERFRGYGLNKVQHAYHMAAAGFEFRLLTRHFCVTVPHTRSPSFRAVFGSAADPAQRLRVEHMYDTFKREMHEKYGYRYEPPLPPSLPPQ